MLKLPPIMSDDVEGVKETLLALKVLKEVRVTSMLTRPRRAT
jgi:hypothetical protein